MQSEILVDDGGKRMSREDVIALAWLAAERLDKKALTTMLIDHLDDGELVDMATDSNGLFILPFSIGDIVLVKDEEEDEFEGEIVDRVWSDEFEMWFVDGKHGKQPYEASRLTLVRKYEDENEG